MRSAELKLQYDTVRAEYCGSPVTESQQFDVELIGSLISSMKNGKAAGVGYIVWFDASLAYLVQFSSRI